MEDRNIPFSPFENELAEDSFTCKIGNTTYEVSTHFSKEGNQTLLQQFRELLQQQYI